MPSSRITINDTWTTIFDGSQAVDYAIHIGSTPFRTCGGSTDGVTWSDATPVTPGRRLVVKSGAVLSGIATSGKTAVVWPTVDGDIAARGTTVAFPSVQYDSFGGLRVTSPHTLFDSKQIHDKMPLFWDDQEVSGSGTTSVHTANLASTLMSVSSTTAGKRVRQTFQRFNYQPGKSLKIMLTGVMGNGGAGISGAMGYFDDENGVFISSVNGAAYMNIRSNTTGTPVDLSIVQDLWNGDKLDGTGPSGHTLDPTKTQIWWCDFEWLGVGTVRTGFVINGQFIICHTFDHSNVLTEVYMSTPNLPVRYEIENDGAGGAASVKHICSTVIVEGGVDALGDSRYKSTEGTALSASVAGTVYAVIGARLKSAYASRHIEFKSARLLGSTTDNFEWILKFNPTVAGTFTYADETDSAMQTAVGVTANTVVGGYDIAGGVVAAGKDGIASGDDLLTSLRLGMSIAGVMDTVVLCVRPFSGGALINGSIGWFEES